jgi:ribosomal 30S subunit maturation factor RimM
MFSFGRQLQSKKKKERTTLFDSIKELSILSDNVGKAKKILDTKEYDLLVKDKNKVFISLADFLEMVDNPNLSLEEIVARCRYVSELDKSTVVVEMYAVAENDHIVLCKDISECDAHKKYSGTKLRIATVRRKSDV